MPAGLTDSLPTLHTMASSDGTATGKRRRSLAQSEDVIGAHTFRGVGRSPAVSSVSMGSGIEADLPVSDAVRAVDEDTAAEEDDLLAAGDSDDDASSDEDGTWSDIQQETEQMYRLHLAAGGLHVPPLPKRMAPVSASTRNDMVLRAVPVGNRNAADEKLLSRAAFVSVTDRTFSFTPVIDGVPCPTIFDMRRHLLGLIVAEVKRTQAATAAMRAQRSDLERTMLDPPSSVHMPVASVSAEEALALKLHSDAKLDLLGSLRTLLNERRRQLVIPANATNARQRLIHRLRRAGCDMCGHDLRCTFDYNATLVVQGFPVCAGTSSMDDRVKFGSLLAPGGSALAHSAHGMRVSEILRHAVGPSVRVDVLNKPLAWDACASFTQAEYDEVATVAALVVDSDFAVVLVCGALANDAVRAVLHQLEARIVAAGTGASRAGSLQSNTHVQWCGNLLQLGGDDRAAVYRKTLFIFTVHPQMVLPFGKNADVAPYYADTYDAIVSIIRYVQGVSPPADVTLMGWLTTVNKWRQTDPLGVAVNLRVVEKGRNKPIPFCSVPACLRAVLDHNMRAPIGATESLEERCRARMQHDELGGSFVRLCLQLMSLNSSKSTVARCRSFVAERGDATAVARYRGMSDSEAMTLWCRLGTDFIKIHSVSSAPKLSAATIVLAAQKGAVIVPHTSRLG